MILEALAVVALAGLGAYVLGGVLLRMAGVLAVLAGLGATALGGGVTGLLVAALGVPLWLLGHWVYGARHGTHRSPLAGLLLGLAPARYDPVRRRGDERGGTGAGRDRRISARLDFSRRAEVTRRRPDQ